MSAPETGNELGPPPPKLASIVFPSALIFPEIVTLVLTIFTSAPCIVTVANISGATLDRRYTTPPCTLVTPFCDLDDKSRTLRRRLRQRPLPNAGKVHRRGRRRRICHRHGHLRCGRRGGWPCGCRRGWRSGRETLRRGSISLRPHRECNGQGRASRQPRQRFPARPPVASNISCFHYKNSLSAPARAYTRHFNY